MGSSGPPHPCTRGDNDLPSLLPLLFPQDTRVQLWSIVCWIQEPPHFPRGPNHSCLSNNSSCSAIIFSLKPHKQKMPSAKKYSIQVDPGIGWGQHTLPASNQACDSVFTMGHMSQASHPRGTFMLLGCMGVYMCFKHRFTVSFDNKNNVWQSCTVQQYKLYSLETEGTSHTFHLSVVIFNCPQTRTFSASISKASWFR